SPNLGEHNNYFRGVATLPTGDVWAVGDYLSENDDIRETLIARYIGSFGDVPVGSPFYSSVQCLACQGVISGYADGTFRPNNHMSRGQLAKVVSIAAGFSEPVGTQQYVDVLSSDPFFPYIWRLTDRGYMS